MHTKYIFLISHSMYNYIFIIFAITLCRRQAIRLCCKNKKAILSAHKINNIHSVHVIYGHKRSVQSQPWERK